MTRKTLLGLAAGMATLCMANPASAQQYYMGQVLDVGFEFCPKGTMEARGTLLSIAANTALFSLLGTTYGGDGVTTFALPDLRSRRGNGQGQGPALSNYVQGEAAGSETSWITIIQLPSHAHGGNLRAVAGAPNTDDPTSAALADFPSGFPIYNNQTAPNVNMAPFTIQLNIAGGNQPAPTLSPYLAMRFCIVTQGIFPSRG